MDCCAGRKQKRQKKKAGTISGPGLVLAGCPDKSKVSKLRRFKVSK
jgi:hypothetical protein